MDRRQALSMLAILAGSALPLEQLEAALVVKEKYTMDDIQQKFTRVERDHFK